MEALMAYNKNVVEECSAAECRQGELKIHEG